MNIYTPGFVVAALKVREEITHTHTHTFPAFFVAIRIASYNNSYLGYAASAKDNFQ